MEPTHSIDPIASKTKPNETARQRMNTARYDPTEPLYLGTTTDTDEPVTLDRDEWITPMLLIGNVGTGKTTLCQQLATQQLHPDRGLCYVTGDRQPFDPPQSTDRTHTVIEPGPYRHAHDATDDVPDEIGTAPTIHSVVLNTRTDNKANTHLLNTLIEDLLINMHQQDANERAPYTLVLDGLEPLVEMDSVRLRQVLAEARTLRLHIIIAVQSLTHLPVRRQRQLARQIQTYITGRVTAPDAAHLSRHYPTITPDDLTTLPQYQWWLCKHTREGPIERQFTGMPPGQDATAHDEAGR